jgi:large subunit ribosomal protein L18
MSNARAKRAVRGRIKRIRNDRDVRIVVFRSNQHVGGQLVSSDGKTLTTISTKTPDIRKAFPLGKSKISARAVGKALVEKAASLNIKMDQLCFDRSGFIYHGLVREIAEGARESGGLF